MNETNAGPDAAETSDVGEDDARLGVAVVTIASSRTLETDAAGEVIETALGESDNEITTREHVGPDHDRVQSIVLRVIERDDVDVVVTAGATSVEPDDVAIEAIEPLLDKELTAFSELFTILAHESVGTQVVAARTLAGVAEGTPVFCLPGNAEAAELGIDDIILPEASHLVSLSRGNGDVGDGIDVDADVSSSDDGSGETGPSSPDDGNGESGSRNAGANRRGSGGR
ncbi:MogA/MoaB family molybdenum cofactor biosynthesis protein [Natrarchaeobius chitinivorans]|uniref:Molybdenum cofactor biosynthesis protein n=1 Tax=Natrarchaeobius chitinivorans TaxID=1679083 RepID=A0A3N6LRL1_NATCH|nr:molybdopterin-binding protein [Natrarchaeobius chitinivorans]RQG92408.1 molybdenum cofactor biosynthesis protein [Natrarchaeobius chitinivorans]